MISLDRDGEDNALLRIMPTLRILLETASGLYRDENQGREYRGDQLLQELPDDVLTHPVALERLAPCVYLVRLQNGHNTRFVLYSRRRHSRGTASA